MHWRSMGSPRPYLVFLSLQANIVAKLEHAGERIVENSDAFLAQREAQNHRFAAAMTPSLPGLPVAAGNSNGTNCVGYWYTSEKTTRNG
jgi:hypothetical protein